MALLSDLEARCSGQCELCSSNKDLLTYLVPPKVEDQVDFQIAICSNCKEQMAADTLNLDHWRCLNESMWSAVPAVQVVVHRLLTQLNSEWALDLRSQMYMDESTQEWALQSSQNIIHKDAHGAILNAGDAVVLIQDLNVKGAGFTAKRGTAVKRIRLVPDNAEHIEGKVEGQQIVILTKYVKKS